MDGLRNRKAQTMEDDGFREPLLHDEDRQEIKEGPFLVDEPSAGGPFTELIRGIVISWNCVLAAIMSSLSLIFPIQPTTPMLSEIQESRLNSLWQRLEVPYDSENPEHKEALRRLWVAAFPKEEFNGIKSPKWKDMGWQGEDPGTDFRGGGFFALENLLYLADNSPVEFQRLLHKTVGQRADWEYPFAIAGVNMTFTLTDVLDLRDSSRPPMSSSGAAFIKLLETSDTAFEDVYCVAFELLDETWLEMKASYMEFPQVMKKMTKKLEDALSKCPSNSVELRQLLYL